MNTTDSAMILIKQATNSDESRWNSYVIQHENHSPYHLFAWKNAVIDAYAHNAHYLLAEEIIDGEHSIVGILPLIIFSKPFSKPSLCALPFCDVGGILANDEKIQAELLAESKKIAEQYQAKTIELRSSIAIQVGEYSKEKLVQAEKVSMIMPLPENSELLFSSFKSKLRSQIRKAEKNGLTYKVGSEKAMLNDFYQVFAHNMKALGSPVHAKQWFTSLLKHYQNDMVISIVYKDNTPIGGGIVLAAGNKAAIPWASTKAEYNRLSPNMMLYWSLLKYLCDNKIDTFDFGRSSYGEGTFKFKKQWGAKPVPLEWQVINLQSENQKADSEHSSGSQLRGFVENIWRKLPLALTIFIGPKIRKYISL